MGGRGSDDVPRATSANCSFARETLIPILILVQSGVPFKKKIEQAASSVRAESDKRLAQTRQV